MDKLVYTAMTGAKADMVRQDVLTHNLANVSTPGFRAQTVAFRFVPVQSADTPDTRVMSLESTPGVDMTAGPIQRTGNPLDIAVNGPGWITVQAEGGEAYTRNGSLTVSPEGVLQTQTGRPVMSDGGPITVPPNSSISIASDGTVSATPSGNSVKSVVSLGRIKLVNPPEGSLDRGDDGLFRMKTGGSADVDPKVVVAPESIEGSNVNPVEALVGMIALARQFEAHMKLIQNAESNAAKGSQLLNTNS
ncbi:MAG TPA: flagellar basal-body rod protein FlgF [Burkholderiales bacterium]|nr:flagellar basal-body rod protein FlgF [Burkholderiales bacterium]